MSDDGGEPPLPYICWRQAKNDLERFDCTTEGLEIIPHVHVTQMVEPPRTDPLTKGFDVATHVAVPSKQILCRGSPR